jgi:hypothetical protein
MTYMETNLGTPQPLRVNYARFTPKEIADASRWAKGAANRILSHYTPEELAVMRKKNQAVKDARRLAYLG